eukprot:223615-Rhodomonas_salina.1
MRAITCKGCENTRARSTDMPKCVGERLTDQVDEEPRVKAALEGELHARADLVDRDGEHELRQSEACEKRIQR